MNGEYKENDEMGVRMHDFYCTDAKDMKLESITSRNEVLKRKS